MLNVYLALVATMPAFNLTKDLYFKSKLDYSILKSIKEVEVVTCILQLEVSPGRVPCPEILCLQVPNHTPRHWVSGMEVTVPGDSPVRIRTFDNEISPFGYTSSRVDDRVSKEETCLHTELSNLCVLLEAENAKEQIELLKKILIYIKKHSECAVSTDPGLLLAVKFLVHLFFIATSKNPVRRVLTSFFQGASSHSQQNVIKPVIEEALVSILNQPIRADEDLKKPIRFEESYYLRHDVDAISALLENFPLGEECLRTYCVQALKYLGQLQKQFFMTYSDQLSPVQQNETMHNCLETVKLANRICQRSSAVMETKVKDSESLQEVRETSKLMVKMDVCILQSDEFLIDCRTTSAMNIVLWMKTLYVQEEHLVVRQLLNTVFLSWEDYGQACDWPGMFSLSQLDRWSVSDSSYLCLCYGILAMLSCEALLMEFANNRCLLLDVLLKELLQLNKKCKDVGNKLLAAKSVCLLAQKLSQYIKNNREKCGTGLLSRLNGESGEMTQILDYIWTSWEDSVDAIRFTVKDTFEHVVAVHLLSLGHGTRAEDDMFLQKLTKSIINDVSWSCKGKYGTLSVLVSHLGSTRMLELHSGIAVDVLLQLKEQTLACYASDLYEKLFSCHMAELSSACPDWLNSWLPCWTDPVLDVLCRSSKTQKKHVIEYILPKVLKTGPATLHHIVSKLSAGSLDTEDGVGFRGHQLGAMIICLRRARALGQLQGLSSRAERRKDKEKKSKAKKEKNRALQVPETDAKSDQSGFENDLKSDQSELVLNMDQSDLKEDDQSENGVMDSSQSDLWYGVVDVEVLRQALSSRDEQVRLDAFALLCENQKTTEIVSDLELDLIKGFVPYNLNNQMPSFRQHFLSHLKKLLSRMKESFAVLKRIFVSTKSIDAASSLVKYKNFLVWLKQCLSASLFPGSVFARRTTCLGGLSILMDIYGGSNKQGHTLEEEFTFYDVIDNCDIQKLLHCLTDTFEDNKAEATRLLIACTHHCGKQGIIDENETNNLFQVALTLSSSTRPQDSTTAAYTFKVLIHQPAIFDILKSHSTRQHRKWNDDKNEAGCQKEAVIYKEASITGSEAVTQHIECQRVTETQTEADVMMETSRLRDFMAFSCIINNIENNNLGRSCMLLVTLLNRLQEQAAVAKSNLIVAAANSPLYPTMQCMRYCLADIDFRTVPSHHRSDWKYILSELISLCLEISEVVSPVVHNSSPEGNIPVDAIKATGLNMVDCITDQSEDRISRSHETVMLMPEYLVVCCWRSVKEISLILGQLTKDVPVCDEAEISDGLLTHQQILDIGSYFTTQLLESKHRGAFELAYAGFVKVTDMLWRSSSRDLHKLPGQWLTEVMSDVKTGDPDSKLCATRRSAGVPFYVQALVTTEPASIGRLCFKQTMDELLALADDRKLDTVENSTSKVHALNILRAMFKDTRLGDDVAPYIANGLKVSVLGFKSPLWAVRNSATLLLSAMMVRIFGVKRSKDETSLSRKNCQTGRTFFHRYPSLYQFLLDQLAEATAAMATGNQFHLHPALYPVLMVLGHLFPSAMEGTDTTLNLSAFIPHVIKCSYSPVLKTRVMAARALEPLVEKDHVTRVFNDLLTLLPSDSLQRIKQNHIHGVLLQIKQLLKIVPTLSAGGQEELRKSLLPKWMQRCALLSSRSNPCLLTRKESLEISSDILHYFNLHDSDFEITNHLTKILFYEIDSLDSYQQNVPGLTDFKTSVCRLSLKYLGNITKCEKHSYQCKLRELRCQKDSLEIEQVHSLGKDLEFNVDNDDDICKLDLEDVILNFLKSDSYDVRKSVLEIMLQCLLQKQVTAFQKENQDIDSELQLQDSSLSRDEGKILYEVVKNSMKIYKELVAMATDRESHHECLTEVFNVLMCHPWSQSHSQIRNNPVEELLQRLIEKEKTLTRDEIVISLIGYSGQLVGSLSELQKELSHTQLQQKLALLAEWASVIQSNCGTEQNVEKQLACVKAVAENATFLLCDNIKILGNLTFAFWKIVIDLIQEDDLEVKDTAAGILGIIDTSLNAPMHPYLALDLLIGQLLRCHGNTMMADCIICLIGWIVEDKDNNEELEERLFDRGEMNTYREPVDIIRTVDSRLLEFLKSASSGESPRQTTLAVHSTCQTTPYLQENFNSSKGDQIMNLENSKLLSDFMMKTLQKLNLTVSSLSSQNAKTGYLNANSFNRHYVDIYRGLTLLKYGFILPVSKECRTKYVAIWKILRAAIFKAPHIEDLVKPVVEVLEQYAVIESEDS